LRFTPPAALGWPALNSSIRRIRSAGKLSLIWRISTPFRLPRRSMAQKLSRRGLMMGKYPLQKRQRPMADATGFIDPVDEAAGWAEELVKRQHKGPGDTVEAAMHRASRAYKIEHQVLWRLRYRKPKDMLLKAYLRLKAAYQ